MPEPMKLSINIDAQVRQLGEREFECSVVLTGDTGKPHPVLVTRRGGSAGQALSIAVSWAFDYVKTMEGT
jgi:hypothetical protein